jgi:hypothetical protein
MIEQSIVHLPELLKDIDRLVSNYLVYLSSSISIFRTLLKATLRQDSEPTHHEAKYRRPSGHPSYLRTS